MAEGNKTENRNMGIITRFPPEPNGYIHLGHLKAMMFDFDLDFSKFSREEGVIKQIDTESPIKPQCILRMDDTNPETERREYVDSIVDDVKWLGYSFVKLTYTSDYFKKLYEFAIDLIKMGCAYVDLSTPAEIKNMRRAGIESVYRSSSIDENLKLFDDMKNRVFGESAAVLRLKIDMQNNNHCLRDPIAYRIMYTPHYKTGTEWCIYPTYDYSHGLIDALENVTDSFCSMEFYVRREQYYWPVLKLREMHKLEPATVLEFGRLNIEGVELSKRKIVPLVESGVLTGFDDPRLYTIRGLRRRGFTPDILKNIVAHAGIGRTTTTISKSLVDFELRDRFDKTCIRAFAVVDPIEVLIKNCKSDENNPTTCAHPNHPGNKAMGVHDTYLTSRIYIEKSDFREVDTPDYYRLAPGKTVRLRYADFVKYVSHTDEAIVVEDTVPDKPKKIKGVIHWVSKDYSRPAIFEICGSLYNEDGSINVESKINRMSGFVEKYVMDVVSSTVSNDNHTVVFQFERLGYYKFDRYENGVPVFIRVIDLTDKYNK